MNNKIIHMQGMYCPNYLTQQYMMSILEIFTRELIHMYGTNMAFEGTYGNSVVNTNCIFLVFKLLIQ